MKNGDLTEYLKGALKKKQVTISLPSTTYAKLRVVCDYLTEKLDAQVKPRDVMVKIIIDGVNELFDNYQLGEMTEVR